MISIMQRLLDWLKKLIYKKSITNPSGHMKFLEISAEMDANLAKIIDAALKHSGLSLHAAVKAVIDGVKEKEQE